MLHINLVFTYFLYQGCYSRIPDSYWTQRFMTAGFFIQGVTLDWITINKIMLKYNHYVIYKLFFNNLGLIFLFLQWSISANPLLTSFEQVVNLFCFIWCKEIKNVWKMQKNMSTCFQVHVALKSLSKYTTKCFYPTRQIIKVKKIIHGCLAKPNKSLHDT